MAESLFASMRSVALDFLRPPTVPNTNPVQKSIWGSDWRSFMGITNDSDGIGSRPSDYAGARTSESYVYRCMDVRSKAISQVPLRAWEVGSDGKRKAIEHDSLELLETTNPNSYVDGIGTLGRYTLNSLDLHGYCTWKLAFNGRGVPTEIYWLTPAACTPLHGYDAGRPELPFGGVRYSAGSLITYKPEEIVYFATDNPSDPIMGTSKIAVLREAINLRSASKKSNQDFFDNSMRPDWVLSGDFQNTEDNVDRIRRSLRRHFSGESNRAPLIVGNSMKASLLTASHKDAEWLAQQRLSQEEISAVFGVPLIYLNNFERATYDNIRTAKLILWHDTMIPECDQFAELLTKRYMWRYWRDARKKGLVLAYDYAAIEGLGEDAALIWERFIAYMKLIDEQVDARVLTPNQARIACEQFAADLGITPEPWTGDNPMGDEHYALHTNIPVSQLGVQAIIDIQAARGPNPELVENVPGAEHAGDNASVVADRLRGNQEAALAIAAPAPTEVPANETETDTPIPDKSPSVPPAPGEATGDAAPPSKGVSPDELERAVGEAVARALSLVPPPKPIVIRKAPHPIPIRDARLVKVQASMIRALKVYFQDLQKEALRTLRGSKAAPINPTRPLYDQSQSRNAITVVVTAGVEGSAAAAYAATSEDYGLEVSGPTSTWIDSYMGGRLNLIQGIDTTTSNALKDTLLEGANAGEDVLALADRVSSVFKDAIGYRSELISRTETLQAYSHASIQSYRDAGLTQADMYDGTMDQPCSDVNGTRVSLAEATRLMNMEHPNGTRVCAPVVDVPGGDTAPVEMVSRQPVEIKALQELGPGVRLIA